MKDRALSTTITELTQEAAGFAAVVLALQQALQHGNYSREDYDQAFYLLHDGLLAHVEKLDALELAL